MAGERSFGVAFNFIDTTRFDEFEVVFDETMTPAMTLITEKVTGDAIRNAPVDRNFFRGSIQPIVEKPVPGKIVGSVFSTAQHAPIIEGVDEEGNETEFARRPDTAFPNFGELRGWVDPVIGIDEVKAYYLNKHGLSETKISDDTLIDEATWTIGHGIVAEGIKPKRPIGNALRANQAWIEGQLDQAIDDTLEQL